MNNVDIYYIIFFLLKGCTYVFYYISFKKLPKIIRVLQHTCLSEWYHVPMRVVQLDAGESHVVGISPRGEYVELQHEARRRSHVEVGPVHQAVHAEAVRVLRVF